MKRTPLFESHRSLDAKLVDFAGWEMPMQYSGVLDEYHAVRSAAGLFDVSHMGRLAVKGPGSLAYLQRVTTNDVSALAVGRSHYSMVCNRQGGIKDDVFVYHVGPDDFLLCANASNREKIMAWLQEHLPSEPSCTLEDRSDELAQLAIQGPASRQVLEDLGAKDLTELKPRHCTNISFLNAPCLVSRTGYTGEQGYELYVPADDALRVWNTLIIRGHMFGLKPAGLGARDLLRLDMGYLLYGNDIMEDTTPLEAGAAWVVTFQKGDFIGRHSLRQQIEHGLPRRLVGFLLLQKAVPRHGFPILSDNGASGTEIGQVTSGNLSPMLQTGIGLGYVNPKSAAEGTRIAIEIRGKIIPAVVVKPPFYKKRTSNS